MALLAAFALTFVTTGCKNGEDGDDGESITSLILRQTGNVWYQYKKTTDKTEKPTYTTDEATDSLATIYLKYDTTSGNLVMAAVGTTYYATKEETFSQEKWASTVSSLRFLGHITKVSDPTTNKTKIANFNDWGDFTIRHLIEALFDE